MKDDAPLCGCACRQSALSSLRCEIQNTENALRRSQAVQEVLTKAAAESDDDQFIQDCGRIATDFRYQNMGNECVLKELQALEEWLASCESIPELAEQALWRLIGRHPRVSIGC